MSDRTGTGSDSPRAFVDGLISRYRSGLPQVSRIFDSMREAGIIGAESDLDNDHIAIRSFGVEGLGIDRAAQEFLAQGYQRRDAYHFEAKKLDAYWFSPPDDQLPRVFISELRVGELSASSQAIIRRYTEQTAPSQDPFSALPWPTPDLADYQALAVESEYASWTLCHGYRVNHLTIAVHDLPPPHDEIAAFSEFIASQGFALNDSGGLIKISGDGLLKQSSTRAPLIDYDFAGGHTAPVPGAYVEFAQRLPLQPGRTGRLMRKDRRDGFETANADRIFESTFRNRD